MIRFIFAMGLILLSFCLGSCAIGPISAPVIELNTIEPLPKNKIYRVKKNDTLYSIAWRYGIDYHYLAKINHLSKTYHIEPGQLLSLDKSTPQKLTKTQNRVPTHQPIKQQERRAQVAPKPTMQEKRIAEAPVAPVAYWTWPAVGSVVATLSQSNKGINIAGNPRESVFAAAPGVVVYSGDALKAYGNLIIIKHNDEFLSAYAYNAKILVIEGTRVTRGQRIAEMGSKGSRQGLLHFEIRRNGKPVNPLSYLPRR